MINLRGRYGLLLIVLIVMFITSTCVRANALSQSNTGVTGLWEYPTAEILADGQGRFGYTNASPYHFYFLNFTWLPWLEINARLSTFSSVQTSYRDYMDKAIDLKLMIYDNYRSSKQWYIPSIAAGINDATGTELMKAYYGVATWHWGNFHPTIGYGSDRLNGFFAGLEWTVNDWLSVKAEYSPLDYKHDVVSGKNVLPKGASKKYNAGIVLKAPWGTEASISYQRGDEFVFTLSQRLNLGGPYIAGEKMPYNKPGDSRIADWNKIDSETLIKKIQNGLKKYVRVRDIDIKLEEFEDGTHKLTLAYENYGHSSHADAMMRILVVLSAVMPETDELVLIQRVSRVPIVIAEFPGSFLFDLRAHSIRGSKALEGVKFSWADYKTQNLNPDVNILSDRAKHNVKAMVVWDPRIDQTLQKSYFDRWSLDLIYQGRYSHGWGSIIDIKFPITNHIDIWWEPDLNDKIRIQQAAATYLKNLTKSGKFWLFAEGGYLDEEWFGTNIWARWYPNLGSFWLGARFAAQRDRDPYSFGGLTDGMYSFYAGGKYDDAEKDPWRYRGWLQTGFNVDALDLDFQFDWGEYLDRDKGYKISMTRRWDDTALGFWYMKTELLAPDRDYTKVGVHMEIPAEKWFGTFFGRNSEHIWEQDTLLLSSWMLNSGREGGVVRSPERLMSQMRPASLKKNVARLLEEYCSYDEENSKDYNKYQNVRSLMDYILR